MVNNNRKSTSGTQRPKRKLQIIRTLRVKIPKVEIVKNINKIKSRPPKVVLAVFLVALTALFSYGPSINKDIPTWQQVYAFCGLNLEEGTGRKNAPLTITFLDVGQGDCSFISADGNNVLIDTGEEGNAERILTLLNMYKVDRLDCLIITHPHSDHFGSAEEILEKLEVDQLIVGEPEESNMTADEKREFTRIKNVAESSGTLVYTAKTNDELKTEKPLTLRIISQKRNYDNLNDESLVVRLDYKDTSVLFTGDIESAAEYALLSNDYKNKTYTLDVDVLKVAHHGSNSSSSKDFLAATSPIYAVISCGKDNPYGHPHKETLETLSKTKIFRTDEMGTIVLTSDGISINMRKNS